VKGTSDATTTAELLALYQEWHRLTAAKVSKNQVSYSYNSHCWVTGCLPLSICWFKEWKGPKNIYFIFFNDSSFHFFGWKQEEIGFKIDAVEAVAMKLLQRLNYSASVMKTSAVHLQDGTFFTFNFHIYFHLCFS
jgi:hypothetical protein